MLRTSRIVMAATAMATAAVLSVASIASANTVELTLTVPIKFTPGSASSSAMTSGHVKPFEINCVIGANLGYATGSGAQGQIVGQGSTATSGTKPNLTLPDGSPNNSPAAKVIITYDDGAGSVPANVAVKPPNAYLCWVQWTTPIPTLAPIFVQGTLQTAQS